MCERIALKESVETFRATNWKDVISEPIAPPDHPTIPATAAARSIARTSQPARPTWFVARIGSPPHRVSFARRTSPDAPLYQASPTFHHHFSLNSDLIAERRTRGDG